MLRYVVYARLRYLKCFCDLMKCDVMLRQPILVIIATQFVEIFIDIFFSDGRGITIFKIRKILCRCKSY